MSNFTIVAGAIEHPVELNAEGVTVEQFTAMIRDLGITGISNAEQVRVNGVTVSNDSPMPQGGTVEYAKSSGSKS